MIGVEPWRSNQVVCVSPAATFRASTISKALAEGEWGWFGECEVVFDKGVEAVALPVEFFLESDHPLADRARLVFADF